MLHDFVDIDVGHWPPSEVTYFRVWATWCGHCVQMKANDVDLRIQLSKLSKDVRIYDIEDKVLKHILDNHENHPFVKTLTADEIIVNAFPTALKFKRGHFTMMDISEMYKEIGITH